MRVKVSCIYLYAETPCAVLHLNFIILAQCVLFAINSNTTLENTSPFPQIDYEELVIIHFLSSDLLSIYCVSAATVF